MGGAGVGLFPKLRVYETSGMPGRFLLGAMPSLESLKFWVEVWTSRDGNIEFDFGSLLNLPMLKDVTIRMHSGRRITDEDWQKAVETVRHGVDSHPNHPVSNIREGRGYSEHLDVSALIPLISTSEPCMRVKFFFFLQHPDRYGV
jgi:hypothetical protein